MRKTWLVSSLIVLAGCVLSAASGSDAACSKAPPELGFRLAYTADGRLDPACEEERRRAVAAAADTTDIFVFSHGWWNDPTSAEKTYTRFIQGMIAARPAGAPADFAPVLIGLYWPSAHFPLGADERFTPGTESGAKAGRAVRRHFETLFDWLPRGEGTDREVAVLVQLVEREASGQPLTRGDFDVLARILKRWEAVSQLGTEERAREDLEAPGEASVFSLSTDDLAEFLWQQSYAAGSLEGYKARRPSVVSSLNVFTFWRMKRRAGLIGESGGYDLLQRLRAAAEAGGGTRPRLHLIGHSFGGKLLSAALTGPRGTPPSLANRATDLVLIQGAFSHFAFARAEDLADLGLGSPGRGGRYAAVIIENLVERHLVVTRTDKDFPLRHFYPLGVGITGDALEKASGKPPRYGALGANGAQRSQAREVVLTDPPLSWHLAEIPERVVNVKATQVIGGHGAYTEPGVYTLLWQLVTAGR